MPTKRTRRSRPRRGQHQGLGPMARAILYDEPRPELEDAEDAFECYLLGYEYPSGDGGYHNNCRALWHIWGSRVMADWLVMHPGTRPNYWWVFHAPELRPRLGGTGTAVDGSWRSVPTRWKLRGEDYPDGAPVDPCNPPVFESEPAYLKRLGLLTPEEVTALRRKRKVYDPQTLIQIARMSPGGLDYFVFDWEEDDESFNVVPFPNAKK